MEVVLHVMNVGLISIDGGNRQRIGANAKEGQGARASGYRGKRFVCAKRTCNEFCSNTNMGCKHNNAGWVDRERDEMR